MSSTNKTTNYQLSQFVGTDIPSILNDYNGDMRKIDSAIHDASVAGGDNASAIAELQSTVGRHANEISGLTSSVNAISGKVLGIESKIPDNASASNPLITAEEIPSSQLKEILTVNANEGSTIADIISLVRSRLADLGYNLNRESDRLLLPYIKTDYGMMAYQGDGIYSSTDLHAYEPTSGNIKASITFLTLNMTANPQVSNARFLYTEFNSINTTGSSDTTTPQFNTCVIQDSRPAIKFTVYGYEK